MSIQLFQNSVKKTMLCPLNYLYAFVKSQLSKPRVAKTILKKENKVGGLTLHHFKIYYESSEIKTVWY